jgi:hypothetical protein
VDTVPAHCFPARSFSENIKIWFPMLQKLAFLANLVDSNLVFLCSYLINLSEITPG